VSDKEGKPTEKVAVDWEAVERGYRAGILSLRELAQIHGCSHVAVSKRAKAKGWTRDLNAKIKAKADDLVNKATVTASVNAGAAASELVTIQASATAIATVRLAHRNDIRRGRSLVLALLSEVEAETGEGEALHQLGEMMRNPDAQGSDRLNDLYRKIISLPSRIDSAKKLSEALKNLIGLEREAWGLESSGDDSPSDVPSPVAGLTAQDAARVYQDFISAG
jgi:hypothetical protein